MKKHKSLLINAWNAEKHVDAAHVLADLHTNEADCHQEAPHVRQTELGEDPPQHHVTMVGSPTYKGDAPRDTVIRKTTHNAELQVKDGAMVEYDVTDDDCDDEFRLVIDLDRDQDDDRNDVVKDTENGDDVTAEGTEVILIEDDEHLGCVVGNTDLCSSPQIQIHDEVDGVDDLVVEVKSLEEERKVCLRDYLNLCKRYDELQALEDDIRNQITGLTEHHSPSGVQNKPLFNTISLNNSESSPPEKPKSGDPRHHNMAVTRVPNTASRDKPVSCDMRQENLTGAGRKGKSADGGCESQTFVPGSEHHVLPRSGSIHHNKEREAAKRKLWKLSDDARTAVNKQMKCDASVTPTCSAKPRASKPTATSRHVSSPAVPACADHQPTQTSSNNSPTAQTSILVDNLLKSNRKSTRIPAQRQISINKWQQGTLGSSNRVTEPGSHVTEPGSHVTEPSSHVTPPKRHTDGYYGHVTGQFGHMVGYNGPSAAVVGHMTQQLSDVNNHTQIRKDQAGAGNIPTANGISPPEVRHPGSACHDQWKEHTYNNIQCHRYNFPSFLGAHAAHPAWSYTAAAEVKHDSVFPVTTQVPGNHTAGRELYAPVTPPRVLPPINSCTGNITASQQIAGYQNIQGFGIGPCNKNLLRQNAELQVAQLSSLMMYNNMPNIHHYTPLTTNNYRY